MNFDPNWWDHPKEQWLGWIPANLETRMITRMNFRIFTHSPFALLSLFSILIAIYNIAWYYKNPRIHPSYHFCDLPSKITILAWKWKFWNFSEFSPRINKVGEWEQSFKAYASLSTKLFRPDREIGQLQIIISVFKKLWIHGNNRGQGSIRNHNFSWVQKDNDQIVRRI